jgi:hypothetical protein
MQALQTIGFNLTKQLYLLLSDHSLFVGELDNLDVTADDR